MAKQIATLFMSILSLSLMGQDITGIWIVKKVSMGIEEMTPNQRWMEFNEDGSQRSGNGWTQHSIGTYQLEEGKLMVVNTNGYTDPNGPFYVTMTDEGMMWERDEDGNHVVVLLERIDEVPPTPGDQLLGVWQLDSVQGLELETLDQMIFYRWDNVIRWTVGEDEIYGTYRVHGHRNTVEHTMYGDMPREHWGFILENDATNLILYDDEQDIRYYFSRTYEL